jgi:hypothetical protein
MVARPVKSPSQKAAICGLSYVQGQRPTAEFDIS